MLSLFLLAVALQHFAESKQSPHILFILADDYGYNDIGYHGSEIKTPAMDKLAKEGVTLENYYVQPICTPTRSTLLTGRYQIRMGLQHGVIWPAQPTCLPNEEITLAQKLKQSGYETHILGKWHLGYSNRKCTPTHRGFDSFVGFYTGAVDFYSRFKTGGYKDMKPYTEWRGYDFRRNESVSVEEKGQYSTTLFAAEAAKIAKEHDNVRPLFLFLSLQAPHTPLQVPEQYLKQYQTIKDKKRRIYAGMVSAMDEAIENVTRAFKESGLWDNTVLIFSSDNGANVYQGGNNWPLRGGKDTLWEGGIRAVGFVSSPLLKRTRRISRDMIHVADWFPTLVGLAGGNLSSTRPLDGVDVWETISTGSPSPRTEMLHNIDPVDTAWKPARLMKGYTWCRRAALRVGDWKLLIGCPGDSARMAPPGLSFMTKNDTELRYGRDMVYLFNITEDPEENVELSAQYPEKVKELLARLEEYNSTAMPAYYPPPDLQADPALHGGVWSPWQDDEDNGAIAVEVIPLLITSFFLFSFLRFTCI